MGLLGILVGLAVLVWFAYRGWSVLLLAPVAAVIAAAFSAQPLLAHWTQTFMGSAAGFIAQFFPMFLLGALFGKMMDDSGSIWRQFGEIVLKDAPKLPFTVPPGVRMVKIDRRSGKRVFGGTPSTERRAGVIWEAFKPESEPRRTVAPPNPNARRTVRSDADFLRNEGGIY